MWCFFCVLPTGKTCYKFNVSDYPFSVGKVCSSMATYYNAPFMIVCQAWKFQNPSTNPTRRSRKDLRKISPVKLDKKIKYYAILECGGWWWCTCQPNIDILITCEKSHYWIWMCQLFLLCRLGFLVVHYENVKPQTHAPARTCGTTSKITFIKTS